MSNIKNEVVQINSHLFVQYCEIVKKITQARKDSGTSHEGAGELIGVSRRTILEFEKCKEYNWSVFVLLCNRFGITIDLFHEEN